MAWSQKTTSKLRRWEHFVNKRRPRCVTPSQQRRSDIPGIVPPWWLRYVDELYITGVPGMLLATRLASTKLHPAEVECGRVCTRCGVLVVTQSALCRRCVGGVCECVPLQYGRSAVAAIISVDPFGTHVLHMYSDQTTDCDQLCDHITQLREDRSAAMQVSPR